MFSRDSFRAPLAVVLVTLALASPAQAGLSKKEATPDERRGQVREMRDETLKKLYKVQPAARKQIEAAAGYAVFSNFGMKILVAGGGSGSGIVVDNATGRETFMKMAEIQAGLGLGVKKFRLVWVFERKADVDGFANSGWEVGAQSTASAKLDDKGAEAFTGAVSVTPGVWLYQLTDDSLALELTAKGTRYYRDADLN